MSYAKLRSKLASEAARLMYENQISFQKATQQAVRRVAGGFCSRKAVPTQREIRTEIARLNWVDHHCDERLLEPPEPADRFVVFAGLLAPLEQAVRSGRNGRAEDLLSHSLRVFDLARDTLPYDEEFLTAALVHEVGRPLDRKFPGRAALEALGEHVTERTAWFIEHLEAAHAYRDDALGLRSRRRLAESEWFDDLELLAACDRRGCSLGIPTCDLEFALGYLRELSDAYGEDAVA
jgi:predicted HD phosphohydrolase